MPLMHASTVGSYKGGYISILIKMVEITLFIKKLNHKSFFLRRAVILNQVATTHWCATDISLVYHRIILKRIGLEQ